MLPIGNPIDEHLADLHVGDWYFLHCVHLERRSVQHLLDGARCRLEDAQGNHLIESEFKMLGLNVAVGTVVIVSVVDLACILLLLIWPWLPAHVLDVVALVVREGAAQIHHLLLTRILQELRDTVELRQRIER